MIRLDGVVPGGPSTDTRRSRVAAGLGLDGISVPPGLDDPEGSSAGQFEGLSVVGQDGVGRTVAPLVRFGLPKFMVERVS
jgi:hypothetical protein